MLKLKFLAAIFLSCSLAIFCLQKICKSPGEIQMIAIQVFFPYCLILKKYNATVGNSFIFLIIQSHILKPCINTFCIIYYFKTSRTEIDYENNFVQIHIDRLNQITKLGIFPPLSWNLHMLMFMLPILGNTLSRAIHVVTRGHLNFI